MVGGGSVIAWRPLGGLMVALLAAHLASGCGSATSATSPPASAPTDEAASRPADGDEPTCYCFHWVHLAENGAYCRPTRAECEEVHGSLDEHRDRTECRPSEIEDCASFACRDSGAECFQL